jgi:hypothetical protein
MTRRFESMSPNPYEREAQSAARPRRVRLSISLTYGQLRHLMSAMLKPGKGLLITRQRSSG